MKIAVTGKGGVGKTTTSALLAKTLSSRGHQVVAILVFDKFLDDELPLHTDPQLLGIALGQARLHADAWRRLRPGNSNH